MKLSEEAREGLGFGIGMIALFVVALLIGRAWDEWAVAQPKASSTTTTIMGTVLTTTEAQRFDAVSAATSAAGANLMHRAMTPKGGSTRGRGAATVLAAVIGGYLNADSCELPVVSNEERFLVDAPSDACKLYPAGSAVTIDKVVTDYTDPTTKKVVKSKTEYRWPKKS